jgi:hypothetical protein
MAWEEDMRTLAAFVLGITVAIGLPAIGKTFDEKKFEQLAKHREIRRANERRYEACMEQCRSTCR